MRRPAWADNGEVVVVRQQRRGHRSATTTPPSTWSCRRGPRDYYPDTLTNYGSLFIGEETTVAYGDKVHRHQPHPADERAARYTGGLWVGKFLKTCTYQKVMTDKASAQIGEGARACASSRASGHAEQANVRVRHYGGRNVPYATAAE